MSLTTKGSSNSQSLLGDPPPNAISLGAARKLVKVDGKPVSAVTLWRWARKGKLGIRLQVWRRGRGLVTTAEHIRDFERAVAEADARRWEQDSPARFTAPTQADTLAQCEAEGL